MLDITAVIDSLFKLIGIVALPALIYLGHRLDYKFKMAALKVEEARLAAVAVAGEVKEVKAAAQQVAVDLKTRDDRNDRKLDALAQAAAEAAINDAEQIALLKQARAADDGMMRAQLLTVAELRRERAEDYRRANGHDDPRLVEAAEVAERLLAEHDQRQEDLGGMSSDSLRAFIERDIERDRDQSAPVPPSPRDVK